VVAVLAVAGCGGTKTAATVCPQVATPAAAAPARLKPPTHALDPSKRWELTFTTSCGTFTVSLTPRTAPRATASLVALARARYFDGTIFHRIVPGFVIQGGDPTQSGQGGPGYTTVDTPAFGTKYAAGAVAMARSEIAPRGAAGSQFFVMTAPAPGLAPDYAVVGRVTVGFAVVERIGRLGDPADPKGTPTQVVTVEHVTVTKR